MKSLLKKIVSVFAVAAMAMSMPLSVSANEISEEIKDTNAESPYYIAPGLDLTDEDVEEIIDKIYVMSEQEGWSEEVTNDMINIWYKDSNPNTASYSTRAASTETTYYTYPVKDFFVAVSVKPNVTIGSGKGFAFYYSNSDNIKMVNNPINIGNAIPLTLSQLDIDSNTTSSQCYCSAKLQNINNTTTSLGNIFTFKCYIESSINSHASGPYALTLLRNNTSMSPTGGFSITNLYNPGTNFNNKYVGALGDIDNDADVDKDDLQYLTNYILNIPETISEINNNPLAFAAADVTEDGSIVITDFARLSNYVKGIYDGLRSN